MLNNNGVYTTTNNNCRNNNPDPNKIIRCAIYTRKSCEEGLDMEYNSLDSQYDSCRKYIESQQYQGLVLITDNIGNPKRYDDGGYSGGTVERPALKELLRDINLGLIDMVAVYKIDRLSRSLSDFLNLIDLFNKNNVSFISVTQNINTNDSTGKLMLNILMSFAQFEREMTGDRIRDKIRMQKSKGMWTGGNIPLGYDDIDKKLIVNDIGAKSIRFIFNTFANQGSIANTINILKQSDLRTKTHKIKNGKETGGINFNRGSLYKILKNKIYIGLIENRKTKDIYRGQHEPIIDETTFNKVQEILNQHTNDKIYDNKIVGINDHTKTKENRLLKTIHSPKINGKVPYLLKGLMRCSCCNSILTPTYSAKKNGIVYRYYKSNKLMKRAINNETNKECELTAIPAEQIENIVLNQIYGILRTPAMVNKIIDSLKQKQEQMKKDMSTIMANAEINQQFESPRLSQSLQTIQSVLDITEKDVINNLKNINVIWNELFPREQIGIVRTLLKEIIVSRTNVKMIFYELGFGQLICEAGCNISKKTNANIDFNLDPNFNQNNTFEINVPISLSYKSGRSFITDPDGRELIIKNSNYKKTAYRNYVDNAVQRELIQAEEWKKELNNKPHININAIAKRERKQNSYVCRILDLVFLAPDIKKLILEGNAPIGLSLKEISGVINKEWKEQRKLLRIES